MSSRQINSQGSIVDSYYSEGRFFDESGLERDSEYKVLQLEQLLQKQSGQFIQELYSVADVGCGPGATTRLLHRMLVQNGVKDASVCGFDVHPAIKEMESSACVSFVHGDFCTLKTTYDMAVLFDVIEHIPSPTEFLFLVSKRARYIALHIPLDDSLLLWLRGHARTNLTSPGHLVVLDAAAALNIVALSGLRVMDFEFSPAFAAPSGKETSFQKILHPFRRMLFAFNPYVLQKTLGGVSLTVLARSSFFIS